MKTKALVIWTLLQFIGELFGMLGRRIVRKYNLPEDIPTEADSLKVSTSSDVENASSDSRTGNL